MKQKRILVPTQSAQDWKRLLADPEKHWKPGYSAMLTAQAWENADGLPNEIMAAFNASPDDYFGNLGLVLAIPEYKIFLQGGTRPSQSDIFALLTSEKVLISMTVEGKAREDFGPTLIQWRSKFSEKGYRTRLGHLLENLGLQETVPDHIRYQLLHRAASAVIEAKRFHATVAAIVVQSFVASDLENHFGDYVNFVQLYGKTPVKGSVIFFTNLDRIRLYSGWVYTETPQGCGN